MITINLDKAKGIAHAVRRAAREAEFKPYDDIIAKRIPGDDYDAAETARQAIRAKYANMQDEINASANVDSIKAAL